MTWRPRYAAALIALLVAAAACERASSPPDITVRADLRIPVEINGKESAPIEAAMLRRVKPDYVQGERRAWRFATLLGPEFQRQDAALEVENARGLKTSFAPPTRQIDGRIAVLALNRKGDLVVAMVPPDDPFPKFHGRGGNRGRSGDPARVTRDIRRIRLTVGAQPARAAEAAPAAPGVSLRVVVDDRPPVVWTRADLEKVPHLTAAAGARNDALPQWSLRELVTHLVDASAIAVELSGEGNKTVAIDPTLWRDTTKVPVLRFNRRGLLKFEWATTSLAPIGAADLRGVTAVRVSIPAP